MKRPVVRELRAVPRFTVNLPVHLSWRAAGRTGSQVRGCTRDISTRGMFVLAPSGPRQGERLEFEIDMALDDFSPLMLVEGEGRIVRVQCPSTASGLAGFAVHNLWFRLREPEQGQALRVGRPAQSGTVATTAPRGAERGSARRLTIAWPKSKSFPD